MTGRYGGEDSALRQARAAAVQKYVVALQDDWRKALPRLLDELDAIDAEHAPAAETASPVKPAPRRRART